jgi:hypothetical protein
VGSPASPRSCSSSCPPRLPHAQAWLLLPLKPPWTKLLADSRRMQKVACPHLEETTRGLAGSIRSNSSRMAMFNIFPHQTFRGLDSATTSSASAAASAAGAEAEIVSTPSILGSSALGKLALSGVGTAVRRVRTLLTRGCLSTRVHRRSTRPRIRGHVWRCHYRAHVRLWSGDCLRYYFGCARRRLHSWDIPHWQTQCANCKTATAPLQRRDPQSQRCAMRVACSP